MFDQSTGYSFKIVYGCFLTTMAGRRVIYWRQTHGLQSPKYLVLEGKNGLQECGPWLPTPNVSCQN